MNDLLAVMTAFAVPALLMAGATFTAYLLGHTRGRRAATDPPADPAATVPTREEIDAHNATATQSAAAVAEMMGPLDDAVSGYRTRLMQRGWSLAAAETMAVEYHARLLNSGGGQ